MPTVCLPVLDRVWRWVFKKAPPAGLLIHIDQFAMFGLGVAAAKVMSAATQIVLGRILGPADYGQVTVVLILAGYFAIPISTGWGLAYTRIVAGASETTSVFQALKSLLLLTLVLAIGIGLCLTAVSAPLARRLNLSLPIMHMAIALSLGYAWWSLSKQIAQAFQKWSIYVMIELIWAGLVLMAVIIALMVGRHSVQFICWAFLVGYLVAGFGAARFVFQAAGHRISMYFLRRIVSHGGFLLLNALIGMATFNIDRLLIHHTLGAEQVGIYQAHFMATFGLISSLMTIIITYAFPLFCRDDSRQLQGQLKRISIIQYPITLLISLGLGAVVLWLYQYPVSLALYLCLSLFCAVQFHSQIKAWYFAGQGTDATRRLLGAQILSLCVNVAVLLILVPHVGVLSGGIALLAAGCAMLGYLYHLEKR